MAFVDKNANLLLLFLIVVSATGLVAATVYFQKNFQSINNDYDKKVAELNKVSAELDAQKLKLEGIQSELLLKEDREEQFVDKFSEIKKSNQKLEEDKKNLKKTIEIAESERLAARAAQQKAEAKLGDAMSELVTARKDIETWRKQYEDTNAELQRIQNSLNTWQTRLSSCKNTCGSPCDGI